MNMFEDRGRQIVALSWLAILAASGTFAGTQPSGLTIASEYPWRRLQPACEHTQGAAACEVTDWPTFEISASRIKTLFEQEEFAGLERAFREIAADNHRYPTGKSLMSAAYLGMREAMPGDGVDSRPGEIIAHWRAKFPKSIWTVFAAARYEYALAWTARTQQYASAVSDEGWIGFKKHLNTAKKLLDSAPPALKDQPLWHNLMLAIVLDLNGVSTEALGVYRKAIERWPAHYEFYDLMISRLIPRWGGSWSDVNGFIEAASEAQKATEGKSLYTRLYLNLTEDPDIPIWQTKARWPELKQGFEDLITRYPDPIFVSQYLDYACRFHDAEAYKSATARQAGGLPVRFPPDWDSKIWPRMCPP